MSKTILKKTFATTIITILTLAIIIAAIPIMQVNAVATTWYVDDSVIASGDGTTLLTAFKTIGEAITAAGDGDTIMVAAGTYNEYINVDKADILLKSIDGATETTIDLVKDPDSNAQFELEGGASGFVLGGEEDHGFTIETTDADAARFIELVNAPSDVEISYNIFDTTGTTPDEVSCITIGAAGASGLNVSYNQFILATVNDLGVVGTDIDPSTGFYISYNEFTGPGWVLEPYTWTQAIDLSDVTASTFSHNIIADMDKGINIEHYTTAADDLTISYNDISGVKWGIQLQDNVIATEVTIIYNNLVDCLLGVKNTGTGIVDAEKNWWGDIAGPSEFGLGSDVTEDVDYAPWLPASMDTYADEAAADDAAIDSTPELDSEYYRIDDQVNVTIYDGMANTDPMSIQTITVSAKSDCDVVGDAEVTLTEDGSNTGIFTGSFTLIGEAPADRDADEIVVEEGDTVTVTYDVLYSDVDASATATIDEMAPVFITPNVTGDKDYYKNEDTIILTATLDVAGYTVTADFSAIDSEYTTGDESPADISGGVYTITYEISGDNTIPDGVYNIPVTAEDAAGNTATHTFSTELDNTAPSVTEPTATPSIIQPDSETSVLFAVSVSDEPSSGVASVTIDLTSIGGDADQEMTESGTIGIYEYTWSDLTVAEEDTYTLTITATDNVGNVNDTEAITLEVIEDTIGPSDPVFTKAVPICGGLIVQGLYAEDILTAVHEYQILMNSTVWATITEAHLTATTWTTDTNYGAFERAAVLAGHAGKYVNITVIAYDIVDNPSNETILYEGLIPEGEWAPIVLYEEWNLISLPLIPESTAREDILSLILEQGASGVIVTYGYNQTIDDWISDPAEMTDGWGYWLYVSEYDVLIVQGTETPEPPATPPTYLFTEDWVLGGFKSTTNRVISDYIASLEDGSYFPYVYVWDATAQDWDMRGTDANLEPGEAFWIWMYEVQSLIPPPPID